MKPEKTVSEVFEEFPNDQKARLSRATSTKYEEIISSFQSYLESYRRPLTGRRKDASFHLSARVDYGSEQRPNDVRLRGRFAAAMFLAAWTIVLGTASNTGMASDTVGAGDAHIALVPLGADRTQWRLETASVRWVLSLQGGRLETSSLVDKRGPSAVEYAAAGSAEFSLLAKGTAVSGAGGAWTLLGSQSHRLPDSTLELSIHLRNSLLLVTRHYLLYPETGIVREWLTIRNISNQPAPIESPSFLCKTFARGAFGDRMRCGTFSGTGYDAGAATKDDRWVSCYEVFRRDPSGLETSLGKVAQGTYFFDRSLPAFQLASCDYEVRTIDGDGNVSAARECPAVARGAGNALRFQRLRQPAGVSRLVLGNHGRFAHLRASILGPATRIRRTLVPRAGRRADRSDVHAVASQHGNCSCLHRPSPRKGRPRGHGQERSSPGTTPIRGQSRADPEKQRGDLALDAMGCGAGRSHRHPLPPRTGRQGQRPTYPHAPAKRRVPCLRRRLESGDPLRGTGGHSVKGTRTERGVRSVPAPAG